MTSDNRYYMIDNLRLLAIVLVVLGHLCETVSFKGSQFLYLLIYTFHMPLFSCISGFCFSYNPEQKPYKIFKNFLYPYIAFQTLWVFFNIYVLQVPSQLQYTTPIWVMWYLPAVSAWYLISFILDVNKVSPKIVFPISLLLALVVGYDASVGYYLSLSRIIVMFPFFFMGIYIRKHITLLERIRNNSILKIAAVCVLAGASLLIFVVRQDISATWAYYATNYANSGCTISYRALLIFIAALITTSLFCLMPDKNFKVLTSIGQNTMSIYLLHGFLVKYLAAINWGSYIHNALIGTVLLTVLLVLFLGSKPIKILVSPLAKWSFPFKSKKATN